MKNLIKALSLTILFSLCLCGCKSEDTKIQENIVKVKENEERLRQELEEDESESSSTEAIGIVETENADTVSSVEVSEPTTEEDLFEDFLSQSDMENLVKEYVMCDSSTLDSFNSENTTSSLGLLSNSIPTGSLINYCALELDKTPESYSYLTQVTVDYENDKIIYLLRFNMNYNKIVSVDVVSKS